MSQNILVVEDDNLNILIYKHIFKNETFTAHYVKDGEEALRKIKSTQYSLVLLDLNLPKLDGFEVARAIRRIEKSHHEIRKPIIMISASFNQDVKKLATKLDVDEFFNKPFHIDSLKIAIDKYLGETESSAQAV
ncbi:MAG: response regulator [Mucilaginibacter sp.]